MQQNLEHYPCTNLFDDIDSAKAWVPPLLMALMENVVCDTRKQVSLSHCIVQASRPRTMISPVPFALGVSLDHVFGSQLLLTTLSRLSFSLFCMVVDQTKR